LIYINHQLTALLTVLWKHLKAHMGPGVSAIESQPQATHVPVSGHRGHGFADLLLAESEQQFHSVGAARHIQVYS
jgi:hypothetical protein